MSFRAYRACSRRCSTDLRRSCRCRLFRHGPSDIRSSHRGYRDTNIYPQHSAHLLISISRDVLCACSLPESSIAPYLTELQKRVKEEGIRVGSYPFLMKGVFVSLIGQDEGRVRELGKEVEGQTQGRAVTEQEIRETKRSVSL